MMITPCLKAFAIFAMRAAFAANTYTSCCSYDGGVSCSMSSYCDASTSNCESVCKGSWATSASAIDQTYLNQKSVCFAKDATATEKLGHACMDWNTGSAPMENAAKAYASRLSLSVDQTPIFAVGSVGHETTNYNMGKCFKFTLEGVTRPLIMQAVNEGGDVKSGNIDVMMGAGGEGAYLGCTAPLYEADPMFGSYSYPGVFGQTALKGGPATKVKCADLPAWAAALDQNSAPSGAESLVDLCKASFDLNLRPVDSTTDGNPFITARSWIACPDELVRITKLKRTDEPDVASPVNQDAEFTSGSSFATRMMDCCKPAAGTVSKIPNFDQNYPAVMSCKSDGFTRMDGTTNPYATSTDSITTTPAVTTTPSATTTPVDPDANKCIVEFWEHNNRKGWKYTMTVDGKGATASKDWKSSNKNDELSSICISQPGCRVWLYKSKKLRGTPKVFTGVSNPNKACGTYYSAGDLKTTQGGPWGISGNFNDQVTSFKVVAAP
jgi:hypothetical protein